MRTFFLALITSLCVISLAQSPMPLTSPFTAPDFDRYNNAIPKPEEVIGHVIGAQHTRASQAVEYFERIGAVSDRVTTESHGRSFEGRRLVYAVVTSPQNHTRLDEIAANNRRLAEDPGSVSDAELEQMPAIIWMGYGVHGNETSAMESALLLLYHLAAAEGSEIDRILEESVIIIDPCYNPDGTARFVNWVNENRGGVATSDPQDREHNSPWPGGRTNHYLFDLNRDWMPNQMPETQARLKVYNYWRPQVVADYHEMGTNSPYFFQPGIPDRTNPLTPQRNQDLTEEIAVFHRRALDAIGSLYYSRERFDDYYYGKGSTYPDINGAVGILYEQGSSRALIAESSRGIMTYGFTIRNQIATSISTIQAGVALRHSLLDHMREFYMEAWQGPENYYMLDARTAPLRAYELAKVLHSHVIEVFVNESSLIHEGNRYAPGELYIIPRRQMQSRLLEGMFDQPTEFNVQGFYDISAWTLPLAFDVPFSQTSTRPSGLAAFNGQRPDKPSAPRRAEYAYVMRWHEIEAPRALYHIQQAGVVTQLWRNTATIGGEELTPGSIIIPVTQFGVEPSVVHQAVSEAADAFHVEFFSIDSGASADPGNRIDLGTDQSPVLDMPRIALLGGQGTNSNEVGEAFHLITERWRIPVSLLETSRVPALDLSRYNVIILAGGNYSGPVEEALNSWISTGGTVLGVGGGASWLASSDLMGASSVSVRRAPRPEAETYQERREREGVPGIPGSIMRVNVDTTHPIAYGVSPVIGTFRASSTFYNPPNVEGVVVARYAQNPVYAGFVPAELAEAAAGKPAILARRRGGGSVIAVFESPNFRAFWFGTNLTVANAMFFGRSF